MTEIYAVKVLKARNLNSRYEQVSSSQNLNSPQLLGLGVAGKLGISWHVSSHDFVSLSLLITISTIRLGVHTNPTGPHLNLTTSAKIIFPTKVIQIGTRGDQNQNIAFEGI